MIGARMKFRRVEGFTLVELIIASTLMTMVLAGVYTTFSIAIKTSRGGEANYQTYQDARRALGLLTRDLHGIPPEALHLVNGYEDSIRFITVSAPMNVVDGAAERLMQVEYRLEAAEDGAFVLVREEAVVVGPLPYDLGEDEPLEALAIALGPAKAFDIATDVRALSFHYQWAIAREMPRNEPPMRAEIVGDDVVDRRLPEGVSIALSLADPGRAEGESISTFRDLVTFRTSASPVPKYLDPRRGTAND